MLYPRRARRSRAELMTCHDSPPPPNPVADGRRGDRGSMDGSPPPKAAGVGFDRCPLFRHLLLGPSVAQPGTVLGSEEACRTLAWSIGSHGPSLIIWPA